MIDRVRDYASLRPGITVLIPTIAPRSGLLRRAIESVYSQTRQPDALLVIQDTEHEGAAATRNRGLLMVDTTYVAFLDDDDEFMPRHLEILETVKNDTGADLIYPSMIAIGPNGERGRDPTACPVDGKLVVPFGVPFGPEQRTHLLEVANFIPVTHLASTDAVVTAGGFPEPLSDEWAGDCEDHGLLVNMLKQGAHFVHVPARTWKYRFHTSNTGGNGKKW